MRKFMICLLFGLSAAYGCEGNTVNVYLPAPSQDLVNTRSQLSQGAASIATTSDATASAESEPTPDPTPSPIPKPVDVTLLERFSLPLVVPGEVGNWRMEHDLVALVTYSDESTKPAAAVWTFEGLSYNPGPCKLPEDPGLSEKVMEALTFTGFGSATDSARISMARVDGVAGLQANYTVHLSCALPGTEIVRNVTVPIETSLQGGCGGGLDI